MDNAPPKTTRPLMHKAIQYGKPTYILRCSCGWSFKPTTRNAWGRASQLSAAMRHHEDKVLGVVS